MRVYHKFLSCVDIIYASNTCSLIYLSKFKDVAWHGDPKPMGVHARYLRVLGVYDYNYLGTVGL